MTIIEIPVTPFTKRIIESENTIVSYTESNNAVVSIAFRNTLYKYLCFKQLNSRHTPTLITDKLTETITISLHRDLALQINTNRMEIGHNLNEIYRNKLYEAIWWGTKRSSNPQQQKTEAKEIIEIFCNDYGISIDVDINYETIYRGWTRYKTQKNKAKIDVSMKNQPQFVRFKRGYGRETVKVDMPTMPSDEELEAIIQKYIAQYPKLFKRADSTRNLLGLKVYVHYTYGRRTMVHISNIIQQKLSYCYFLNQRCINRLKKANQSPIPPVRPTQTGGHHQ